MFCVRDVAPRGGAGSSHEALVEDEQSESVAVIA
jgi:hypothetical protein